jgi:hypothetical protein
MMLGPLALLAMRLLFILTRLDQRRRRICSSCEDAIRQYRPFHSESCASPWGRAMLVTLGPKLTFRQLIFVLLF